MKFKQSEHDAFQRVIIDAGMNYTDFTFTKKKGWLSVNHSKSAIPFMYHRKSETRLSNDGKWEEYEIFFIQMNNKKEEFSEFKSVLDALSKWLRKNH